MQEEKKEDEDVVRVERNVSRLSRLLSWFYHPKYACGHRDVRMFALNFHGHIMEMDADYLAKRRLCGDCQLAELLKDAVRCFACGVAILPGDAISLCYVRKSHPPYTVAVQTPNGPRAVGCMSIGCAEDGMSYCGNWSDEGVRLPKSIHHGSGIEIKPDMNGELYPRVERAVA